MYLHPRFYIDCSWECLYIAGKKTFGETGFINESFYLQIIAVNKLIAAKWLIILITRLRQSEGQQLKSTNKIALLPVRYSLSIGPGIVPNDPALFLGFWKTVNLSSVVEINLLLTKLARDRTVRISSLGLFSYCQDLGPIFSQSGPHAWSIRYISSLQY